MPPLPAAAPAGPEAATKLLATTKLLSLPPTLTVLPPPTSTLLPPEMVSLVAVPVEIAPPCPDATTLDVSSTGPRAAVAATAVGTLAVASGGAMAATSGVAAASGAATAAGAAAASGAAGIMAAGAPDPSGAAPASVP